jgi:phosphoribosylaminoimidazole carboxylase PurE protein
MRGLKVIIAGAGMAAALPGVAAAHTDLPVIGVPIDSGQIGGMDALLAIAQMPPGVPVACVAIDGAKNAGHLAARIINL